jgi:lipocalin
MKISQFAIAAFSAPSAPSDPSVNSISRPVPLCTDATQLCNSVNLDKYLGKWYEIGSTKYVKRFQGPGGCVEAEYSLINPKLVRVYNSAVLLGIQIDIEGQAKVLSNSELAVSFPVPGQPEQLTPNYIIKNVWFDEAGNYLRSLVVSPIKEGQSESDQSTWILAREQSISDEEIVETLDYAIAAGYNPTASEWTKTEQVKCRRKSINWI